MVIKLIKKDTDAYEDMIRLRIRHLLEPIGVPASYIDREKEKNDLLIAAFDEGRIAGCCVLTERNERIVQLRQMVVDPGLRAQKLGAAILGFAEDVAANKGFSELMMHARDEVIGFYEKCGYTVTGPQFFEVGIAHHKMQKLLANPVSAGKEI